MTTGLGPQFIVDEKGNRTAVILDVQIYEKLLDAWEDLQDIRDYDEAKALNEEAVPFEQAVQEIEDRRE